MTDELLLLHVLDVSESQRDHELFRLAAATSTVPIELLEADNARRPAVCSAAPSI